MSILKRLIFFDFLRLFLLAVIALTALFLIVDFFDRIQRYVGEWGAPTILLLRYMFYKTPFIVYQMTPMALPLSSLIALGLMNRNHELVAIRASGISIRSVLSPVILFAFFSALALFSLGEYFVPKSTEKQEEIYERMRSYRQRSRAAVEGITMSEGKNIAGWFRAPNGFYFIGSSSRDLNTLQTVIILEVGEDFKIVRRWETPEVHREGDKWIAKSVTLRAFKPDGTIEMHSMENVPLPLYESAQDLKQRRKDTEDMSFFELKNYIELMESGGSDMDEFKVDLWAKVSYPLSGLLLVILSAPFGMIRGRKAGLSFGIIISLLICISFYEFHAWMLSIGRGGIVHYLVSAWGADVVFGVGGIIAYLRAD